MSDTRRWSDYLAWAMVAVGIAARIVQFAFYRPLWLDENALAFNLVNRSIMGLWLPLDYGQAAPPGFLMLEKLVIQLFGASTYTLRLIPMLAGIGSMLLIYLLAKRIAPSAAPLIVGLFATANWPIYYAAEVKQYSLDILIAAGLLLILNALADAPSRRSWIAAGIAGALSVWFSHPALFVLAGGGAVLFLTQPQQRRRCVLAGALWLLSFAAAYVLVYRGVNANAGLNTYWQDWFFEPSLMWLIKAFFEVIVLAAGLNQPIMVVLTIFGLIAGLRTLPAEKSALVLAPIGVAFAASVLHMYPFNGRLLLFILPGLLTVIGAGLQGFIQTLAGRYWIIELGLCILLLVLPFKQMSVPQTLNHEADTTIPIQIP